MIAEESVDGILWQPVIVLLYAEAFIVPSKDLKGMPWGMRDVTFGCS